MTALFGAVDLGPRFWTPAWIVLYMLAGLIVLVVVGFLGALLLGSWHGRKRQQEAARGGERASDQR